MGIKEGIAASTLGAAVLFGSPASAATYDLYDGTFGNLTFVQSAPATTLPIGYGAMPPLQSIIGGVVTQAPNSDPIQADSFAIHAQFNFANTNLTGSYGGAGLGIIDNSLTYNPLTMGTITSLSYSMDKMVLATNDTQNIARLLLEQDNKFYLYTPSYQTITTGKYYNFNASGLTSASFQEICLVNCTAGTTGSQITGGGQPNFSGDTIYFGTLLAANNSLGLTIDGYVDNFNVAVSAVPEPSTWAMMILGFVGLGFMAYRQKASVRFA